MPGGGGGGGGGGFGRAQAGARSRGVQLTAVAFAAKAPVMAVGERFFKQFVSGRGGASDRYYCTYW